MKQIHSKVKLVALPAARNRFLHCSVQSLHHTRTMTCETEREKLVIPSEGNVVWTKLRTFLKNSGLKLSSTGSGECGGKSGTRDGYSSCRHLSISVNTMLWLSRERHGDRRSLEGRSNLKLSRERSSSPGQLVIQLEYQSNQPAWQHGGSDKTWRISAHHSH
jgi:hypothetical protein